MAKKTPWWNPLQAAKDVGGFVWNTAGIGNDVQGIGKIAHGNIWGGLGNIGLGAAEGLGTLAGGGLLSTAGRLAGFGALQGGLDYLGNRVKDLSPQTVKMNDTLQMPTNYPGSQAAFTADTQVPGNIFKKTMPANYPGTSAAFAKDTAAQKLTTPTGILQGPLLPGTPGGAVVPMQLAPLTGDQLQALATQRLQATDQYNNMLAELGLSSKQAQQGYNASVINQNQSTAGGISNLGSSLGDTGMAYSPANYGVGTEQIAQYGQHQNALSKQDLINALAQNAIQKKIGAGALSATLTGLTEQGKQQQAQNTIYNVMGGR